MTEDRPLAPGDRIGFVGLGRMGTPMVARLTSAGYEVVGFDLDGAARERLAVSASVVDDIAAVVDGVRAVVLMLPDSTAVRSVLDGPLGSRLNAGQIVMDMGSSEPPETVRHAGLLTIRGVGLIDAPVSGGVSGAHAGTLTIMVGGADTEVARVRPMLDVIGERIVHVGPVGAGHAVKALNNLLSASHLLATSEAMVVAQRFGLDISKVLAAINTSSGRSGSSETKWPRYVLPEKFDSGFALTLMLKDIRIAASLARTVGCDVPHAVETVRLWSAAAEALPPAADHTEIARWVGAGDGD